MEKANISIYDDLVIIDETETFFKDMNQLNAIATSVLRSTPRAEMVEVFVNNKLKLKLRITNRGAVKKESLHPGWGGARPNSGPKRKGPALDRCLLFKVTEETYNFINKMDSFTKAKWLRAAIQEKRDREEKEKGSQ